MAAGEFAKPVWDLIDDMGGEEEPEAMKLIVQAFVCWLTGDDIEKFVEHYRRVNEVPETKEKEEQEEESFSSWDDVPPE